MVHIAVCAPCFTADLRSIVAQANQRYQLDTVGFGKRLAVSDRDLHEHGRARSVSCHHDLSDKLRITWAHAMAAFLQSLRAWNLQYILAYDMQL